MQIKAKLVTSLMIIFSYVLVFSQPVLAYQDRRSSLPPMYLLELREIHWVYYAVTFIVVGLIIMSFILRRRAYSLRYIGVGLSFVFGVFITVAGLVKIPLWRNLFGVCYPKPFVLCGAPGSWENYLYTPTMLPLGIGLLAICVALTMVLLYGKKRQI